MDIPDQTIYDYSRFEPIMMDNYVVDTDNADHEISWTTMGQRNLTVSIKDRVAFISLADKMNNMFDRLVLKNSGSSTTAWG